MDFYNYISDYIIKKHDFNEEAKEIPEIIIGGFIKEIINMNKYLNKRGCGGVNLTGYYEQD